MTQLIIKMLSLKIRPFLYILPYSNCLQSIYNFKKYIFFNTVHIYEYKLYTVMAEIMKLIVLKRLVILMFFIKQYTQ